MYPENPAPIIEDTNSDCEELRDAAWRVLGVIRHPVVRAFALSKVDADVEVCDVISVLVKNYQYQDAELLGRLVKSVQVDFRDSTYWHGIQLSVLGMLDDGIKVSPSLLYYIYETTYCSRCREKVVKQMGSRRLLTEDILKECLYDSNEAIRKYVSKILKRRNSLNNKKA